MIFRISRGFVLALCIAGSLAMSGQIAARNSQPPHWSYSGDQDPEHWGNLDPAYSTCSLGKTQSPINITGAVPADLPKLEQDYVSAPLAIIDNGHSVQINYPVGSQLVVDGHAYTLKQFHFHHPSEEHIDGKAYPLVAHLVHADADGHLAVVAVLFDLGAPNPLIDTLWKNIPSEKGKAQSLPDVKIDVADLLPASRGYYTFAGSLTTPPCSEGVAWYVLKAHSTISKEQLAAFAKLYPLNARPIQPTDGREIKESK